MQHSASIQFGDIEVANFVDDSSVFSEDIFSNARYESHDRVDWLCDRCTRLGDRNEKSKG